MSRFDDAMVSGVGGLFAELSDELAYWPDGESGSELLIDIIHTGGPEQDEEGDRGMMAVARAEVMVKVSDVAAPVLKRDVVVRNGVQWRVMELEQTVGGVHRMTAERVGRSVVGKGRGS